MPTAQEIIDQMKSISSGRNPSSSSDFFPQEGSILMRPEDPSKMNIPVAGGVKTPSGNIAARTKEIFGGAVPYNPPAETEVPEETIQAIKQKYTLAEPQATQPLMQPYTPPEALKYKSDLGWGDVAIGAIPAVIDAFSGGSGAALGRSVDYYGKKLADESEKDKFFRQKIAEIEKERQKQYMKGAGKEAGKLYEAMDDQGNQVWMTREQAIGAGLIPKAKSSASEDRFKIAEMNRKQQKLLADRTFGQNLRKELVKDPDFSKQRVRYSATNDAINILNQRSPVGDRGVTMIFAKGIFGEVGNLTAQEQAKFEGSPAYQRVWDRLSEKYLKTGKLDEADRKDLLDLAVAMRDASKEGMKQGVQKYAKSTGALGFDPEAVFTPFLDTSDIAPQYQDLMAKPVSSGTVNRAMTPKSSPVPPPGLTKEQFIQWKKKNG
jgi:hypothetical protein